MTKELSIETPFGVFTTSVRCDGSEVTAQPPTRRGDECAWISDQARVSASVHSEGDGDHGFTTVKLRFEFADGLGHVDLACLCSTVDHEPSFQQLDVEHSMSWGAGTTAAVSLTSPNWRWIQALSARDLFPVFEDTISWDSFTYAREGLNLRLDFPREKIAGEFAFTVGWTHRWLESPT